MKKIARIIFLIIISNIVSFWSCDTMSYVSQKNDYVSNNTVTIDILYSYSALKKNIDTNNTTNVQDITVQKLIKPIEIDTTFKQSNTQQAIMTKQDNIKTPEEKSFIVIFNK